MATVAGYTLYQPEVDDDSVDLGVAARGGNGTLRSPRLEIQVKCTSTEVLFEQYGLAVRAHAERLSVFCIGELRRRGPSFVLENPRQLAVEGAGA